MLQPVLQRIGLLRPKHIQRAVAKQSSRALPAHIQSAATTQLRRALPRHIQRKILRILIAFPLAQLVTYLLGYGTSPTCLISTAMVLFSASPIETAVYKKMNERIYSNLLGIVIGYVSTLLVQPPTARIIIGGLMIVFVAYWFPKLNISPASTSVAMLIVAEAPRYEMYLSLQERAFLVVIGCVIAYIVVRFIVPPRHHKTLYQKSITLSLSFIEQLKVVTSADENNIELLKSALANIKKETDRYDYIIENMNKSKDPHFLALAHVLKSLKSLKDLAKFIIEHDPPFQQLEESYQAAVIKELSYHLEYHTALLSAEPPKTIPASEEAYSFGQLACHRDVTSFLYKIDKYRVSLEALHTALLASAVRENN